MGLSSHSALGLEIEVSPLVLLWWDPQSSCRGLLLFGHHTLVTSWLPSGPGQTAMETAHEKITVFSEFISTKLLPGYHLFCCVLWLEGKPKTLGQAQHQWGVQVRVCSLLGEAAGFVLMRFCFCWQNTFLSFREELLIITTKRIIRLKIRKDQERENSDVPSS